MQNTIYYSLCSALIPALYIFAKPRKVQLKTKQIQPSGHSLAPRFSCRQARRPKRLRQLIKFTAQRSREAEKEMYV